MLRSNIKNLDDIEIDEDVYFCREKNRCIRPSIVLDLKDTSLTFIHDKRIKTHFLNRVIKKKLFSEFIGHSDDTLATSFSPIHIIP